MHIGTVQTHSVEPPDSIQGFQKHPLRLQNIQCEAVPLVCNNVSDPDSLNQDPAPSGESGDPNPESGSRSRFLATNPDLKHWSARVLEVKISKNIVRRVTWMYL
jgi:hypothetical protein